MFDWIIKISATAIILSIISHTLPVSKIRIAAMISLGFIFLTIVIFPLKDIFYELGNKKNSIEMERDILLSQIEENDFLGYSEVIKVYKERLVNEISDNLSDKDYALIDIIIAINEDNTSSSFGTVQNVVASVSIKNENNKEDRIGFVEIPDVVIDKNGIGFKEKDNAEHSEKISEYEKEIKEIIQKITGLEHNYIIIRLE